MASGLARTAKPDLQGSPKDRKIANDPALVAIRALDYRAAGRFLSGSSSGQKACLTKKHIEIVPCEVASASVHATLQIRSVADFEAALPGRLCERQPLVDRLRGFAQRSIERQIADDEEE